MPISAPGSRPVRVSRQALAARKWRRRAAQASRGFTLVELLIVIAIVALSVGLVAMALPDGDASRLEEEGARLTALLEMARAEARVSGAAVRWVPGSLEAGAADDGGTQAHHFRFIGVAPAQGLPTRWLDRRVSVQVVGGTSLLLGPEAILPPQRVVLSLGQHRLELASDGLGPFTPTTSADAAAPPP